MTNQELYEAIAFAYDALLKSDGYTGARPLMHSQLQQLLSIQLERARKEDK